MVEKLKLITKGIHWSLAFKALIVAASWILLPEWMAWAFGGFFYFSALFRARHMGFPLLASFVLAHLLGQSMLVAVGLGIIFYLILGLKELVFIDRRLASTVKILGLLLMAGLLLYLGLDAWSAWMPVKTLLFAGLFFTLSRRFILTAEGPYPKYSLTLGIMAFVVWEVSTGVAFLPLDFISQSAITIFSSFILFEWFLSYIEGNLKTNKILLYVSFLFILVILILSAAKWAL